MSLFNSIKHATKALWYKLCCYRNVATQNIPVKHIPDFMFLDNPPEFFPHGKELSRKLRECLELEIVASCVHKISTKDNTYFVEIQLPCSTCLQKDHQKFNLFIDAMEKCYKLRVVSKHKLPQEDAKVDLYKIIFKHHKRS